MDAPRKLGSFRKSFSDKRKRERLLSSSISDYSELPRSLYQQNPSGFCSSFSSKLSSLWGSLHTVAINAWEIGRSDPRKIVFSAKMGLALMLISLLIFFEGTIEELSRYSVWAILTVVVVFEFSIGATLSKGFNRGLGTLSAGGLGLAMGELSQLAGEWEEVVIVIGIFLTGFCITYAKLYPTMKPYEYGFRVFLITYCFIMVSGYNTREFVHTAVTRFALIALGAGVSFAVNVCVYPIWAGEDLHNLVAKNFTSIATSLEGCISGYLNCVEYKRIPSKILTYQASDDPVYSGYRSAVESSSQEEALVGFAVWEPPHGPYKMCKYPWKDYIKVSGALRYCSFTVMALHGCILSEIQAPAERRQVFRNELQRVGTEGAKVLRELGNKLKNMEKLGCGDILYEVNDAAEELQKKVDRKSYLLVSSESWEIGQWSSNEPQEFIKMDNGGDTTPNHKSHSEAIHNFTPIQKSKSLNIRNFNMDGNVEKQPVQEEEESKTYDSASALSLATFTSLLIEFVARLQNLVDSFEDLSEKANFREPMEVSAEVGFFSRLSRYLKFWQKDEPLLV